MKEEIRQIGDEINQKTCELRRKVKDLKNYNNECDCDDCVTYDFTNIMCQGFNHKLCLNCGGYIEK